MKNLELLTKSESVGAGQSKVIWHIKKRSEQLNVKVLSLNSNIEEVTIKIYISKDGVNVDELYTFSPLNLYSAGLTYENDGGIWLVEYDTTNNRYVVYITKGAIPKCEELIVEVINGNTLSAATIGTSVILEDGVVL